MYEELSSHHEAQITYVATRQLVALNYSFTDKDLGDLWAKITDFSDHELKHILCSLIYLKSDYVCYNINQYIFKL